MCERRSLVGMFFFWTAWDAALRTLTRETFMEQKNSPDTPQHWLSIHRDTSPQEAPQNGARTRTSKRYNKRDRRGAPLTKTP